MKSGVSDPLTKCLLPAVALIALLDYYFHLTSSFRLFFYIYDQKSDTQLQMFPPYVIISFIFLYLRSKIRYSASNVSFPFFFIKPVHMNLKF